MKPQIVTAKLTGNPDKAGWSQVHDFTPKDKDKVEKRGRLIAVLATSSGPDVSRFRLGREILTRLHEEYFGHTDDSSFDALGRSVRAVCEEFSEENDVLEITAISVVGNVVNAACCGGARLLILRDGYLLTLVESESVSTKIASGRLKTKDILLLGTSLFFKVAPEGVIKAALGPGSPESAIEALAPLIHSEKKAGKLGLAIVGAFSSREGVIAKIAASQKKTSGPTFQSGRPRAAFIGVLDRLIALLPERKIVVRQDTSDLTSRSKKRSQALVGVILLTLLVVSIFLGIKQRSRRIWRGQYEKELEQALYEFEEAQSLSELNKSRARELILASRKTVRSLKDRGVDDPRLDDLADKITTNLGTITGIYEVEPKMFLDLGLIRSEFKGERLVVADGVMRILDTKDQRLVGVAVDTKRTQVIAGPDELFNAFAAAAYADRSFVLSDDGIREVGTEVELIIKPEWDANDILMAAFAGNIYVLDKSGGNIFRYSPTATEYIKRDWLGAGVEPDFSQAVSWSIDGAIWVLKESNKILKFSLGSPKAFSLSGLDNPLSDVTNIYVDEDTQSLYILDRGNARVVVVDKESGEYKAQYSSEKFSEARGFVVSEEEKKAVFLTGDKLYEINLEHLD